MKKTIIFLSIIFIAFAANAQKVYFGIKGGLNVSSLNIKNNSSVESKTGFHVGVLTHIHASKTWALQPEIFYSQEGAKETFSGYYVDYNLRYINVPVLLQYFFNNGFRLEGGPQMGFLLKAKTKSDYIYYGEGSNGNFQSTAISIPLGIGYLMSRGLGIDARYIFGLSNINDNKYGDTFQGNVFQFGIFYQFSDTKTHHHHK